jgi:hypothetical protein
MGRVADRAWIAPDFDRPKVPSSAERVSPITSADPRWLCGQSSPSCCASVQRIVCPSSSRQPVALWGPVESCTALLTGMPWRTHISRGERASRPLINCRQVLTTE